MFEAEKSFENKEILEPTPRPNLLDIVKIDDRWAQVKGAGNVITYLDNESYTLINWDEYTYKAFDKYNELGSNNIWVSDIGEDQITYNEYMVIRWGPEQKDNPNLRENVTVFGIYTKKWI